MPCKRTKKTKEEKEMDARRELFASSEENGQLTLDGIAQSMAQLGLGCVETMPSKPKPWKPQRGDRAVLKNHVAHRQIDGPFISSPGSVVVIDSVHPTGSASVRELCETTGRTFLYIVRLSELERWKG